MQNDTDKNIENRLFANIVMTFAFLATACFFIWYGFIFFPMVIVFLALNNWYKVI